MRKDFYSEKDLANYIEKKNLNLDKNINAMIAPLFRNELFTQNAQNAKIQLFIVMIRKLTSIAAIV